MNRFPLLPLALALTMASAGACLAQASPPPGLSTAEVRVTSKGLDINTEAGAERYVQRIYRAATLACGGAPDTSPLVNDAARKFRLCRVRAMSDALARTRSPVLSRQFAGPTGEGGRRLDTSAQ